LQVLKVNSMNSMMVIRARRRDILLGYRREKNDDKDLLKIEFIKEAMGRN
jgi:hypothetical protein